MCGLSGCRTPGLSRTGEWERAPPGDNAPRSPVSAAGLCWARDLARGGALGPPSDRLTTASGCRDHPPGRHPRTGHVHRTSVPGEAGPGLGGLARPQPRRPAVRPRQTHAERPPRWRHGDATRACACGGAWVARRHSRRRAPARAGGAPSSVGWCAPAWHDALPGGRGSWPGKRPRWGCLPHLWCPTPRVRRGQ